jgi:SAM-dependent methyltransferase
MVSRHGKPQGGNGTSPAKYLIDRRTASSGEHRAITDLPEPLTERAAGPAANESVAKAVPEERLPRHNTREIEAKILTVQRDATRAIAALSAGVDAFTFAKAISNASIRSLFGDWAETYDQHMFATGHDQAVEVLIKQVVELHRLDQESGGTPIFDGKMLEMGCGTGTPIKLLSRILPPGDFSNLRIVANDISDEMRALAQMKLVGMDNVRFSGFDIRQMPPWVRKVKLAMLAQTFPFITDPERLELENSGQVIEKGEHREAKYRVINHLFGKVLEWNGYFLLIDEWPTTFTQSSRDPREQVRAEQFYSVFRPLIERNSLYERIISRIPCARFVFEGKARIDGRHSMYAILYKKDPDKLNHRNRLVPNDLDGAVTEGVLLRRANEARADAVVRLLEKFKAVDVQFTAHYCPINGEKEKWVDFVPLFDGSTFDSREEKQMDPRSRYNTIILAGQLHNDDNETRGKRIARAVSCLREGGALIVIDEWGAPKGSINPVSKRTWRNVWLEPHRENFVFEAALREPIMPGFDSGMYGYVYRKKV